MTQQLIRDQIAEMITTAMSVAQEAGALPEFGLPTITVERSRQGGHGDYASPTCLQLARLARTSPRDIASRVVEHMSPVDFASLIEVAGPGYINITLSPSWLAAQVPLILSSGDRWGYLSIGAGRRTQVEYVSANPTGPITVASTRNAVIGDVLANVLEAAGYEVEREYYVNDAGSQIRHFGESIYSRYMQALGHDVPFPDDGYQGHYVTELGVELAQEHGDHYATAERHQAVRELGAQGIDRMIAWIREDLIALGLSFDTWFHEKSLYESGLFDRCLQRLRDSGHIIERDEATWFTSPELEADAVVIRSPGVIAEPSERPTYLASDIAYVWNKLVDRGFDRAIYVWGADHHGDVPRVEAATRALGLDSGRIELIVYQMVILKRGGEVVRMSKRTGDFVTLRDLLDEVGPDPIRFMLLTRTSDTTMDFDLDLAVEQSDKNPVYYVQYAHARISSILRYAAERDWDINLSGDETLLVHESELALVRKMLELQEVVAVAASQLAPHYLTFYAQELASAFHSFYRDCRVVDDTQPELTRARLMLVRASQLALSQALGLLGVSAPERM
jgi:arginyl-tRNA synthetase